MANQANNARFLTEPPPGFFENVSVLGGGLSAATVGTLTDDTSGGPQNTFIQTQSKNDVRKASFIVFGAASDLGGLTIPAGSLITDAYFRFFSNGAWTGAFDDISCALVAKDGFWNALALPFGKSADRTAGDFVVLDTGAATIGDTGITANTSKPMHAQLLDSTTIIGQVVEMTAAGSLGQVDVNVFRGAGVATNVFMDVYAVGGDGGPTGPVLATSDPIVHNTIGTLSTNIESFVFSGGDQIPLADATKYAFVIRTVAVAKLNVRVQTNALYAVLGAGSLVACGLPLRFSDSMYIDNGSLPLLYEADDTTIRTAPNGDIINFSFPEFPTDNTWFEVRPPDLKHLIQEWVNAPGYTEGDDPLAVQFAPTADSQVGVTRQWDDHELYISWRQPQKYSHWRGGSLMEPPKAP
jgi:hypothetical protein